MNKKQIISFLKKLNLDENKYVVISGAAMVLYGFKETTSDIDISVKEEYYNELINTFNCEIECIDINNNPVYFIENVVNFGLLYYTDEVNLIEGIRVQSVEELINLKKMLNRDKDRSDLKLIFGKKE